MGIGELMLRELERRQPGWREAAHESGEAPIRHIVEKHWNSVNVRLEIADFDRLSYAINAIMFSTTAEAAAAQSRSVLDKQIDRMIERISYLYEPLALIEFDEARMQAQIRSRKPFMIDGTRFYFELLLRRGNRLSLHRYVTAVQDQTREEAPFILSKELLHRLLDDLAAALQEPAAGAQS